MEEDEQRIAQEKAKREDAEEAAREALEKLNQAKAKLEAAEREFTIQKASFTTPSQIQTPVKPERSSISNRKYGWIGLGILAFVLASGGIYFLLNKTGATPTSTAPAAQGSSATDVPGNVYIDSEGNEVILAPGDPLGYDPIPAALALEGMPPTIPSQAINAQNVAQIAQLARWGKGSINQLTYSPDGAMIAVATSIGTQVFDAISLTQIYFIGSRYSIKGVGFTNDSETLIAVTQRGDILRFKASDGSFIEGFAGNFKDISSLSISPNASTAVVSGYGGTNYTRVLHIINLADGAVTNDSVDMGDNYRNLNNLTYSPDNRFFAANNDEGNIYLWSAGSNALIRTMEDQQARISYLTFSPDSNTIATISNDGAIILWDTLSGEQKQTFEGHGNYISNMTFLPDGNSIIYRLGEEGMIRIRDIRDGNVVTTFSSKTESGWGNSLIVSPDGKNFLLTIENKSLSLWNIAAQSVVQTVRGYTPYLNAITLSDDGKYLVSGSELGDVWQIEKGEKTQALSENPGYNTGAVFASQAHTLAYYDGYDGALSIWSLDNGVLTKTKNIEGVYYSYKMSISPDGSTLAFPRESDIELWDVNSGNLINNLTGHTDSVTSLVFSPNGELLASGSDDKTIILWNVADGSIRSTVDSHLERVDSIAFSPDSEMIASSAYDGSIILSSTNDGKMIRTIELPPRVFVDMLAFSPNGQVLASGSNDGTIYLWRVDDGELIGNLAGHANSLTGLIFTPDGKFLISSSHDGTIRLWGINP